MGKSDNATLCGGAVCVDGGGGGLEEEERGRGRGITACWMLHLLWLHNNHLLLLLQKKVLCLLPPSVSSFSNGLHRCTLAPKEGEEEEDENNNDSSLQKSQVFHSIFPIFPYGIKNMLSLPPPLFSLSTPLRPTNNALLINF